MGEKLTILYIGTQKDASFLRKLLKQTAFKGSPVFFVSSLSEIPASRKFDLIISDFTEGVESITMIKQLYPEAPILYFGVEEQIADQAVSLGAQDFLPKTDLDASLLNRIINFALEREEHHQRLKEKTFTDDLTGLYNRRGFMTLLEQQMHLTKRTHQGFMLFMLDLDFFKKINDTYGHPEGDAVLMLVASALKNAFRSHDIIARIGGDEFAVLALNSRPEASQVFKRHLFQRLKELNATDKPYLISCSIGSVYYDGKDIGLDKLLAIVDKDLYRSKKERHHLLLGKEDKI